MASLSPLLERRVVFVTGKGGTGKTVVTAALARAAAARGLDVVACELAERERLPSLVGEDVRTASVGADDALRRWLVGQLRSAPLAGLLERSNVFRYFAAAAPGVREMATITRVWELADGGAHDLVLVDLPASGHGLGLLRIARTFADVTRVGPIAAQARAVRDVVEDPAASAVVAVARADELAVSETLDLEAAAARQLRRPLDAVVVNAVLPARWRGTDLEALDRAGGAVPAAARRAARGEARRAREEQSQLRRLRRATAAPVATLPFLAAPRLGPAQVDVLARRLA